MASNAFAAAVPARVTQIPWISTVSGAADDAAAERAILAQPRAWCRPVRRWHEAARLIWMWPISWKSLRQHAARAGTAIVSASPTTRKPGSLRSTNIEADWTRAAVKPWSAVTSEDTKSIGTGSTDPIGGDACRCPAIPLSVADFG